MGSYDPPSNQEKTSKMFLYEEMKFVAFGTSFFDNRDVYLRFGKRELTHESVKENMCARV